MGYRKRSFNHKLVLSYLILVLIVVSLVSLGAYLVCKRVYRKGADEINQRTLFMTMALCEEKLFQPLMVSYVELFISSEASREVNRFFQNSSMEPMDVYFISRCLRDKTITNPYISDIHLYSVRDGQILSSRFGYGKDEGVDRLNLIGLNPEDLKQEQYPAVSHPVFYASDGSIPYFHVIYPTSLSQKGAGESAGYIIFTLNGKHVSELLGSLSEGSVTLAGKDGTVICGDKQVMEPGLFWEQFQSSDYVVYMDGNRVVSSMKSAYSDLCFIAETSVDGFYPAVKQLVWQMFAVSALMLAGGAGVSFLMTRHVNKPIEEMVGRMNQALYGCDEDRSSGLEETVGLICREFYSLDQFTKSNRETIKNQLLLNLYLGRTGNTADLKGKESYIGFALEEGKYVPAIIRLKFKTEVSMETYQMTIYQWVYELQGSQENLSIIAAEAEEHCIAVLYQGRDRAGFQAFLQEKAEKMRACIYIGMECTGYGAVGNSFSGLRQLIPLAFFYPETVMWEESGAKLEQKLYKADLSQLSAAVKTYQVESAMNSVRQQLQCMDEQLVSSDTRQEVLLKLIAVVSQEARAKGIHLSQMETVIKAGDIDDFCNRYELLLEEWAGQSLMKRQDRKLEDIEEIRRFVEKHYKEDISLPMIAEHMNMHPVYVSRLFKEQTGSNMTEYIREVKLLEAERLVKETNITVEMIAEETGYHTPHYFIRQFKEKYGMTPAVYRKNKKKKE